MPNARPEGCVCRDIETDWNVNGVCGGVFATAVINGVSQATKDPGCCEIHMKPWGHRRGCPIHDHRSIEPYFDQADMDARYGVNDPFASRAHSSEPESS